MHRHRQTRLAFSNAVKLDPRDIQILLLLQQDARIKMADLASRISLSVTPTWHRVKRLEAAGFITGYHARIDLLRLPGNITDIYVTVLLEEHRTVALKKFETAVMRVPEIISCHAITGSVDYIVRFLVRDIAHYQRVIEALLDASIGIKEYVTYVVTKDVKDEHIYSAGLINAVHTTTEDGG
jgi:Lrp/AsnC family transcriptional regulator, regulator of ectoine-degradation genes